MMSTGSRADTGKVDQLFEKISNNASSVFLDSANNLEIEERSIKNIAQKVQLKLFDS